MRTSSIIALLSLSICLLTFPKPAVSVEKVLFDWNEAGNTGTSWSGWTWVPTGAVSPFIPPATGADGFGTAGWMKNSGSVLQGNWWPRSHAKEDTGNISLAVIDNAVRAPSTTSGGSLKVYDIGTTYLSGWWFNMGKNYNTLGLADATTNRMSIYAKVEGLDAFVGDTDLDNMNFYFGTYLCWPGGGLGGEDCPHEANAQANHYYHYLTMNSGGWTHILLDQSPQHNRGDAGAHIGVPDQRFAADGVHHYFQYMNNFYAQVSYPNLKPTSFWIDEIKTYTAAQPENEVSVATLFVSYWPGTNAWELGFNDNSWSDNVGSNSVSTHEVRYSTNPITNANFTAATPITPTLNSKAGANAGAGRIKRPNPWKFSALTRFTLPADVMTAGTVYFAVKDVSSSAKGDGHDAPSSLIKTIDYSLSTPKIQPPQKLIVVPAK